MKILLLTLIITFLTIIMVAWLINFCRKRLAKTPHGLSGMCHQKGGKVCSSCMESSGNETRETATKGEENN